MGAFGLCLAFAYPRLINAQNRSEPLEGHVILITGDHLDIDIGNNSLKGGDIGVIKRAGVEIGLASVLWVDVNNTSMRVISSIPDTQIKTGDLVVFQAGERRNTEPAAPAPTRSLQAGPLSSGTTEEFIPLLAPTVIPKKAISTSSNIFHGRMRGWQLYQVITPSQAWYSASRLDSDGSIERLYGRPWSFVWSGNASYRDGSSFSSSDDFKRPRPHMYRLTLAKKMQNGGFIRMGRFFPSELSGLGYIDGAQTELPAAESLKFGGLVGFRPDRIYLGFADKEPIASGYGTLEKGTPRSLYFLGTLGVFHTLYRGKADELAVLYDQRADLGPKLNLFGTCQVDFNAGAAQVNKQPSLSRADLTVNAPLALLLNLRGGVNHYAPVDIAAERDLAGGSNLYLNNGYWRYWVGDSQTLLWTPLWLSEDISFTKTQGKFQPGSWRVGISRGGLPGLPNAFLTVTTYNLYNSIGPEYGGTVSGSLPFFKGRFNIDGNAGFRYGPTFSDPRRRFRASDISGHINWRISEAWNFDAGASRSYSEQIQSSSLNGGLSYRW